MEVVYARCCGLDIHKRSVVACVIVPDAAGKPKRTIRRYSTMTDDLLRLGDRLASEGVTHVALESTGVYWKPVYNLLEGRFALLLVNAQHLKAVPGRKTDVCDAAWLAELLRHGLLEGSFVPDRAQRELRELTRYRTSLIRERAREANRVQATLEGANIKLAAVADLAQRRLRARLPALERALAGRMGAHQRFLLARQLAHIDVLDAQIARLDAEVAARLRPFEAELARLDGIPGIGRRTAEVVLAEIGTDLRRFPTAQHLASWAGMAPGNKQSAGKRLSGRTRKGNRWLRAALVEAAHGAARTKGTYLAAQYRRLAARRGAKRAAVAVGHSLLVIAYHLLREQTTYRDLGSTYFDARDREAVARRAVGRLQALGFTVTIQRAAPPAPAHPQGSADVPEVPVAV